MSIVTNKKRNMEYWDAIDNVSEEFVREFAKYAQPELELDDDAIMEIGKAITVKVLEELKDLGVDTEKAYPYVDENY